MANQKLQVARALQIYKSDNADIPFPNISRSGANTSVVANKLVVAGANFTADQVAAGDIVYNTTTGVSATVTNLDSATQISLNADIFLATPNNFAIYKGGANDGCVIYVGEGGDVEVTTAGGDRVIFYGLLTGQFVPVNVTKVWSAGTNALNLLALW